MGKWLITNKWVIASLFYVAVVVGGFSVYDEYFSDETKAASVEKHGVNGSHSLSVGKHEETNHDHESGSTHEGTSEVNAYVVSNPEQIKIFLKDKTGNPVNDLEINHEKLFHLIMVDEHLQKYYHIHPSIKFGLSLSGMGK